MLFNNNKSPLFVANLCGGASLTIILLMILLPMLSTTSKTNNPFFVQAAVGNLTEPPLLDGGILTISLIGVFMIVVPAGLINFIPAMFMFGLIVHFAGIIKDKEIMYGFSNPGVVAVALLGIILEPIGRLPVVKQVSFWAFGGEKGHRTWQLTKILVGQSLFSLFLPNAPHAQLFTPILRDVAVKSGMHPKFVLMPVSIIIAASNFLLIASASNLIASGVLKEFSGSELGMGDLAISNIVPTVVTIFMCLGLSNLIFPSEIDDDTLDRVKAEEKQSTDAASCGSNGFMSQTKFKALFEVFPNEMTEEVTSMLSNGHKLSEIFEFLPADIKKRVKLIRVEASNIINASPDIVTTSSNNNEPSTAVADDASRSASTSTFFQNLIDEEDTASHVLQAGDRLVVEGDVTALRAFRTLLGLAWVGISETTFHKGLPDPQTPKENEESSTAAAPADENENEKEMVDKKENQEEDDNNKEHDDDDEDERKEETFLKTRALYRIRESHEGLHAFLPFDKGEMKKIRFAIVVVSHNNPALGKRLDTRFFVELFRCTVVSCRREEDGETIIGRELALHVLQAGDTLLLRLRPRAATVFANHSNLLTNFYDVEGLGNTNQSDALVNKHYFILPGCCESLFPNWGETITTSGHGSRRVLVTPPWFQNVTLLIFVAIIAAASAGISLAAATGVGVCIYVLLGIMTPRECVKAVDWNLIVGIAFSFILGSAMTNSKIGAYIGYQVATSGATGFPMILLACFLTSIFGSIVSNKGAIQLLWPILGPMMDSIGLERKVAAIILANCCVSGFYTVVGCPSHMVVQGPGAFTSGEFFIYGFPIFIVYSTLTAVFLSIEYNAW